jgi:hypothetical protein
MPIQTETSDQTTYWVMFGQRDRGDPCPGDSWSDGSGEWRVKLASKKSVVFPLITNESKSWSG